MAVKASAAVTISCYRDTQSITRYYLLQSSTLAKPSKPTVNPPGGSWDDTEPAYTSGSTNSLYLVDLTVFSDGTYQYSDVSLSSSYEAAKAAYNKAVAAGNAADEANSKIDGLEVGGRNLARGTSSEWSDWVTPGNNKTNVVHYAAYAYLPDNKAANDEYAVSVEIEFSGAAQGTDGTFGFLTLGNVDGSWSITNIWCANYPVRLYAPPEDGVYRYTAVSKLKANAVNATKFALGFRCDYWDGNGKYRYRKIKVEKGNKATDWTPAPEDVQSELDTLNELTTTENERTVIDGTKIKTGSVTAGRITVKDADGNTVFDADANGKTVQIGGFAVDADKLTGEKVNISGSEITLTGPDSDVFEQSAHITDANIVWYANDGSGFGARGHIGTAAGFPTLNPDPDGYLHINALYKGYGIRFGYDGGTPEAWFDMDTYGMKAYMPIRVYNEDQSSYAPVNYDYARAWYYLVKQAEGDPGPDTVPVTGSGRAITSGAMYPADVSSAVTQLGVSGVTFEKSPSVYTIGKTAHVICRIVLAADGVYSGWVELFSGLPKARVSVYEACPYRGATYSTPLDICVDTDGVFWIRRGTYGSYAFYVNLCYPIA